MLIDAHLHVWRAVPTYPDPGVTIVSPLSDVPIELLREYMDEYGVDRAVLVQPLYLGEGNSYVADCARAEPERFAAVCVVDPRRGGAEDRLEYWVKERGCRGLRLRPKVPDETQIFGDPSSFPVWERAGALRIPINLLADLKHLSTVAELAARFPEVTIVIDHMAHPDVTAGADSTEFLSLLDLAQFPGVFVKVTGYYYHTRESYPYKDCWEFFRRLYDRYGPARLLWGSDFPHVLLKSGYRRCLKLQERAFPFLDKGDLELIMGGNAARLYWPLPAES